MMRNITIGGRLAAGFAGILLLMAVITGMGVWRLQVAGELNDAIVNDALRKERLVNVAYKSVEIGVGHTIAAAKNPDRLQQNYYKELLVAIIKRNNELFKQINDLITDEAGQAALKDIAEKRKILLAANTAVFKEKDAGNEAAATKIVDEQLLSASKTFLAAMGNLASMQNERIEKMTSEARALFQTTRMVMLSLGIAAIIVGMTLATLITRSITRPLKQAVSLANQVAVGHLDCHVDIHGNDEAGQLMQALKGMNTNLSNIVKKVRNSTHTIAAASTEIAQGNLDLSDRTEQQASSLEETASAMEELTATVKQNANNAVQADQMVGKAAKVAQESGELVAEVVTTMRLINDSSRKIVDIITVIDGIAFQTNILALNAAVEAARAGEQGRGFAVVASEVRSLAQRSAGAAKEIKALIEDSVSKVEVGSKLVERAGVTMDEVVSSVRNVTTIVSEITSASVEQSDGIEQVNQAIALMDESTQQNAALVEQAAAATKAMQVEARILAEAVSVFRVG
ncbi:methyl-accepting chemotaxis protein [Herbaspirillum sp. VT-16-41]|uniref:methyl-accepting chemotaxis protein n=1 Tax=Herbaspirillum sp. VT-16-41 TaxID=1953765 RepID=UPI0027384D2F|nr:methyl-accepting chemotaxis protein [Herbaspirillum sp. VT-16-41]